MTDLAVRDEEILDPTGGRLVAWAAGLTAAHRIGTALCSTSFAPAHFRGKPDEAAAAILFGDEIGLSPTQALRSIYVINGQPSLYARQMVALVLHHGHDVWTVEKSDSKVTVAGKRRGSSHVIEETWTVARAQRAGYTNNKKYQTDPQAMLYARAAGDVCRQVAPDALAGLAFTVEEMELADEPTVTVARNAPKKAIQRKQAPPVAEPDVEPEQESEPLRTPEQAKRLKELLDDLQLTDPVEALAFIAGIVGHAVKSTRDLTVDECDAVNEALENGLADDPEQDASPAEPSVEDWPEVKEPPK